MINSKLSLVYFLWCDNLCDFLNDSLLLSLGTAEGSFKYNQMRVYNFADIYYPKIEKIIAQNVPQ